MTEHAPQEPTGSLGTSLALPVTSLRDCMRWPVTTVMADTSVQSVRHLLLEHAISGVPVVDAHHRAIGILSMTDLLRISVEPPALRDLHEGRDAARFLGYEARLTQLGKLTVGQIMSRTVATVSREHSPVDVARLMSRRRIHRVVVVDDEQRVSGLITSLDLLHWVSRSVVQSSTATSA